MTAWPYYLYITASSFITHHWNFLKIHASFFNFSDESTTEQLFLLPPLSSDDASGLFTRSEFTTCQTGLWEADAWTWVWQLRHSKWHYFMVCVSVRVACPKLLVSSGDIWGVGNLSGSLDMVVKGLGVFLITLIKRKHAFHLIVYISWHIKTRPEINQSIACWCVM